MMVQLFLSELVIVFLIALFGLTLNKRLSTRLKLYFNATIILLFCIMAITLLCIIWGI